MLQDKSVSSSKWLKALLKIGGNMAIVKECSQCKRPLPVSYEFDICPTCKEINLFAEVREFIRNNDVNEFEVAEKFGIPRNMVKSWIRDGRIEYKDGSGDKRLKDCYCIECGTPIFSGTMCGECLRKSHLKEISYVDDKWKRDDGHIRFTGRGLDKK